MTDNEIIKALECCFDYKEGCDKCPIKDECFLHQPQPILLNHTLDLINRQQAEIERLHKAHRLNLLTQLDVAEKIKAEAIKDFVHEIFSPFEGQRYFNKKDLEAIVNNLAEYY